MKTACGSSGTVVLSDGLMMETYTAQIDFSGKQLVVIGNSKTLDARENGKRGSLFPFGTLGRMLFATWEVTSGSSACVVVGNCVQGECNEWWYSRCLS
jgi:hypothetical protein